MPQMTLVQAINDALRTEMRRDPTVIVMGEDVGARQRVFIKSSGQIGRSTRRWPNQGSLGRPSGWRSMG
jgi:pyruvate/2-oxoglutarate/acetoin dehydrogenase E1 component